MSAVDFQATNDAALAQSEPLLELLSDPRSYSERTERVERIDTHISWVFLTDRHAYKLKKPVKFDFLDFSSAHLRRQACEEEVRLNRRLAPDVYLGVVPIAVKPRGALKLGGTGPPVDWVVRMRRLPAGRALDRLLARRQLNDFELQHLAEAIAKIYQQLPPLSIRTAEYRQHIEAHVRANRCALTEPVHHFCESLVQRVHASQLRLLRLAPDLLNVRARDGHIIEGHGDLRPEHIYLDPQPKIIDCIEFNAEFRQIDVLDELGFLAMECDYLGSPTVGDRIVAQYQRLSGDRPPDVLLDFYKSYRASVRAKVLVLRLEQLALVSKSRSLWTVGVAQHPADFRTVAAAAEKYLRLADRYGSNLGPPLLLIVRGLPGSGKSTLATELADSLGIDLLQTDRIRQDLFGTRQLPAEYGEGPYHPTARNKVYEEMFRRTADLLEDQLSVILDGTFLAAGLRREAVSLARRHGAMPLVISCKCPDEIAIQRIAERMDQGGSMSETRPEFLESQRRDEEADFVPLPTCEVDTTNSPPAMVHEVYAHLRDIIFPAAAHAAD